MRMNQVCYLVDFSQAVNSLEISGFSKLNVRYTVTLIVIKLNLWQKVILKQKGIYYGETFLPVVRFTSIHLILTIMAYMDLKLHQMDVKMAFLNRKLDKEIYIG